MKKRLFLLSLLLLVPSTTFAKPINSDIKVAIKDTWVKNEIFIDNGRTLLPLREISEKLGYQVLWDKDTKSITIISTDSNGNILDYAILQINNKEVIVLDANLINKSIQDFIHGDPTKYIRERKIIDVPPQIINNSTYVPIRAVSDIFAIPINWSAQKRTVVVGNGTTKEEFLPTQEEWDKYNIDLVGDKSRKIYYVANDPNVAYIRPADRVIFTSNEKAKKAGYKPFGGADARFRNSDTSYLKDELSERSVNNFNFDDNFNFDYNKSDNSDKSDLAGFI